MAFRGFASVFVLVATCGASEEVTPTSQQAGAPAGVCLLQKSPGELKSGLDRLGSVLSNVHRLLDRHKELNDRLHQGGRHIGKAAREAHSTVGKALTQLRQSSESLIDVAGTAGSHAALHAALLQLSKPASDLKSGLDRLEASAADAEADEKKDEEGQQTNKDVAPEKSNKKLAASEKDEGLEGQEKQQGKENEEKKEGDQDAIDEKSKKKFAASQQEHGQVEQDQQADKSSKQFSTISRHEDGEEKEEQAEEEGEDEAEEKNKKKLADVSQKGEGVRDGEDRGAHDKSENEEASASHEEEDGKGDQKDKEDGQKEGNDVQQEGEAGEEDEEKSKKKVEVDEKDEKDGEADDKSQGDEAPASEEDGKEEQNDREDEQKERDEDEDEGDVKSKKKLAASQEEDEEEEEGSEDSPSPAVSKKSLAALELQEEEGEDADEEAYEANMRKLAAIERDIDSLGASVAALIELTEDSEDAPEALIELTEDSEDAPEVSQDPMANGFPKKVAPKHDVDHDAMNMKATKMSIKGLPKESSYENHLTQTADWRNEYKWSTEAPSPARSGAARALPLVAALAASLAVGLM